MLRTVLLTALLSSVSAQSYTYVDPVTCATNTCPGDNYGWLAGIIDTSDPQQFNATVPCTYGAWQDDGVCSVSCGGGTLQQTRTTSDAASCTDTTQTVACNTGTCETFCGSQVACAAGQYRKDCGASGAGTCALCASCPGANEERDGCSGLSEGTCACVSGSESGHKDGAAECITSTYTEVVVSAGQLGSEPYYTFTVAGSALEYLELDTTYRFVRAGSTTNHPFWFEGGHSSVSTTNANHGGGIKGDEWLQITTGSSAGSLDWLCTNHASVMFGSIAIGAPAATCDAYQCPSGYESKANPSQITGDSTDTCCDAVQAAACPKDLNGDNVISAGDILAILTSFGPCPSGQPCPKDLNGDNVISAGDILAILTSFGPC